MIVYCIYIKQKKTVNSFQNFKTSKIIFCKGTFKIVDNETAIVLDSPPSAIDQQQQQQNTATAVVARSSSPHEQQPEQVSGGGGGDGGQPKPATSQVSLAFFLHE